MNRYTLEETTLAYQLLKLKRGDTSESELKTAYRTMAMQWHPDRNKSPEAEAMMRAVNAAAEVVAADLAQPVPAQVVRRWSAAPGFWASGTATSTGAASNWGGGIRFGFTIRF